MLVRVKAGSLINDLPSRSGTLQVIAVIGRYHRLAHGVSQVRLKPKDVHPRGSSRVRVGDDTSRDGRVSSKTSELCVGSRDHRERARS